MTLKLPREDAKELANNSLVFRWEVWAGDRNLHVISVYMVFKDLSVRKDEDWGWWTLEHAKIQRSGRWAESAKVTVKWLEKEVKNQVRVVSQKTRECCSRTITLVNCSWKVEKNKNWEIGWPTALFCSELSQLWQSPKPTGMVGHPTNEK